LRAYEQRPAYLGRADTDQEAVDNTADNQHRDAIGSADENRADTPDDRADLNYPFSFQNIGDVTRD